VPTGGGLTEGASLMAQVTSDGGEFAALTAPFRRELLAYCYRMVGSVHDAEDLVQEVYLRAWRFYAEFEGRSSLRTWLYRIATNVCLRALQQSSRRALPSGLGGPEGTPTGSVASTGREVAWLQPIPDVLLADGSADPAAVVVSREGMRLAFVAALQYLTPRQRAVLILCDVLRLRAAEVAELLGTTPTAVDSTLRRARGRLDHTSPTAQTVTEPSDSRRRALLDRYVRAFEEVDVPAITRLLTDDAVWEMPPTRAWYAGRDAIGRLLAARMSGRRGDNRLVGTAANGQPARAVYARGTGGGYRPHSIQVLTVATGGIARVVAFHDPALFALFGLPDVLATGDPAAPGPVP
jgi:RNA polymerase sigma-70 factor, ECF subfamily